MATEIVVVARRIVIIITMATDIPIIIGIIISIIIRRQDIIPRRQDIIPQLHIIPRFLITMNSGQDGVFERPMISGGMSTWKNFPVIKLLGRRPFGRPAFYFS